jgi:glutathione synthase/RimK-type ligase-like ATP-grasp enzyme
MTPGVLLLSGLYDFSTDLVAAALGERGVAFLRLNREQLPNCRLTLDPVAAVMEVRTPGGFAAELSAPDLRAVLFRQPVFLRNTPARALSVAEQLERSQWSAFLRGLCVFDGARWMNHPARTYLAESKPYQLRVAARLGFNVPRTRIGNDVDGIRSAALGDPMIVKSVDTVLIHEGGDCLFTYSTASGVADWQARDLQAAPVLCQELLRDKTDIRVTVIGDSVFAVRVEENGRGIDGDWRVRPRDQVEFAPTELSEDCAMLCRRLAATLGLPFAAIDLVESHDARDRGIVFIEVNPTGEWGWLVRSGLPIDAAIAEWLAGPDSGAT